VPVVPALARRGADEYPSEPDIGEAMFATTLRAGPGEVARSWYGSFENDLNRKAAVTENEMGARLKGIALCSIVLKAWLLAGTARNAQEFGLLLGIGAECALDREKPERR
jgi:hypothetical protein